MRRILLTAVVALLAAPATALAGGNPNGGGQLPGCAPSGPEPQKCECPKPEHRLGMLRRHNRTARPWERSAMTRSRRCAATTTATLTTLLSARWPAWPSWPSWADRTDRPDRSHRPNGADRPSRTAGPRTSRRLPDRHRDAGPGARISSRSPSTA